jgi:hypothetical protein
MDTAVAAAMARSSPGGPASSWSSPMDARQYLSYLSSMGSDQTLPPGMSAQAAHVPAAQRNGSPEQTKTIFFRTVSQWREQLEWTLHSRQDSATSRHHRRTHRTLCRPPPRRLPRPC